MCCSYMVLTNPHMKPRIQFIIMKDIYENRENLSKVTPVYGYTVVGELSSRLGQREKIKVGCALYFGTSG